MFKKKDIKNDEIEKKVLDFVKFLDATNFETKVKIFYQAEKLGYHFMKTRFYSPIPITFELSENQIQNISDMSFNDNSHIELLLKFKEFSNEFIDLKKDGLIIDEHPFSIHNAPLYFSFIRYFKPKKIFEVGAGVSTWIAFQASQKNPPSEITVIDPFVQSKRKKELPSNINFIEDYIQNVPIEFFKNLEKNDILFIDGSHVSKFGSDVNFVLLKILPSLQSGVIIHFHDIFLPYDYPKQWVTEKMVFWNEQYILDAFLYNNPEFEILFGLNYFHNKFPDKLTEFYHDSKIGKGGTSFWFRKK